MDFPTHEPERFEPEDVRGISACLAKNGFVAIREAASAAELEQARELLWEFLATEQAHENGALTAGWDRHDPSTWTDDRFNDPEAGLMGGASHCDAFWFVRTLPRVRAGFAAVYGTSDLVTSFDRASINRPASCGAESVLKMGSGPARLFANRLHTHFNQDGYGEDVLITYGVMPLWDMDRRTGATAIVPGSHRLSKEIEARRRSLQRELFKDSPGHQARAVLMEEFRSLPASEKQTRRAELFKRFRALPEKYPGMAEFEDASREAQQQFFEPFTELGLEPGIIRAKAGDLVIFDTGLYHGCCNAEDPSGDALLRTIFIQSMVPVAHLGNGRGGNAEQPGGGGGFAGLDHTTTVLAARRRAYETGTVTGGSVLTPDQAVALLEAEAKSPKPIVRDWASTPAAVRRLVCPIELDLTGLMAAHQQLQPVGSSPSTDKQPRASL